MFFSRFSGRFSAPFLPTGRWRRREERRKSSGKECSVAALAAAALGAAAQGWEGEPAER